MYKCGLLLLLFILVSNYSFAQNVSAKQIKMIFKESMQPRKHTSYDLYSRMTWQSPNNNNEYYNADTIMLYSYEPENTACIWVNWGFQGWNRFKLSTYYQCKGCGVGEINPHNYKKKIELVQRHNHVYMHICSNDSLENCFLVSSIETISDTSLPNKNYKIILIRKK